MDQFLKIMAEYYQDGEVCKDCGAYVDEPHTWSRTNLGSTCRWGATVEKALNIQWGFESPEVSA